MVEAKPKPARKAAPRKEEKPKAGTSIKAELKLPGVAVILSYRGGRKTRSGNQMLVSIEGADSKPAASAYIGRRVVWKTPSGKAIHGAITHAHGGNGVLRVRFSRGMPGEALGKRAKVV
jgi:large subunit ribosomal protein L35Ae